MILYSLMRYIANLPIIPRVYASAKAVAAGHTLPPGKFVLLDPEERSDRTFLLQQSKRVGPVFKAIGGRRFLVCVVGLPVCQRFLQEHSENVTPVTMELESLFPKGFLRGMKRADHKHYRKSLMQAIDSEVMTRDSVALRAFVREGLAAYAANQQVGSSPPEVYIKTLNTIASGLLINVFFGAPFDSEPFETLMRMYDELGPNGLKSVIGKREKQIFETLRDYLLKLLETHTNDDRQWLRQSIMGRMHHQGALDATSLGNLIYMVEMGRFDMYSLFRWMSKYAADHPDVIDRISAEPQGNAPLADAFVLETLRMNQSERLMRVVHRNIMFDGHLIPKRSMVRLCLWESHKSSDSFPDPFLFNPDRFITHTFNKDQFSPFGIDHHSCPFSDISIKMSSVFISVLASGYTLESVEDGPPVRAKHHWQPARRFSLRLKERGAA